MSPRQAQRYETMKQPTDHTLFVLIVHLPLILTYAIQSYIYTMGRGERSRACHGDHPPLHGDNVLVVPVVGHVPAGAGVMVWGVVRRHWQMGRPFAALPLGGGARTRYARHLPHAQRGHSAHHRSRPVLLLPDALHAGRTTATIPAHARFPLPLTCR